MNDFIMGFKEVMPSMHTLGEIVGGATIFLAVLLLVGLGAYIIDGPSNHDEPDRP